MKNHSDGSSKTHTQISFVKASLIFEPRDLLSPQLSNLNLQKYLHRVFFFFGLVSALFSLFTRVPENQQRSFSKGLNSQFFCFMRIVRERPLVDSPLSSYIPVWPLCRNLRDPTRSRELFFSALKFPQPLDLLRAAEVKPQVPPPPSPPPSPLLPLRAFFSFSQAPLPCTKRVFCNFPPGFLSRHVSSAQIPASASSKPCPHLDPFRLFDSSHPFSPRPSPQTYCSEFRLRTLLSPLSNLRFLMRQSRFSPPQFGYPSLRVPFSPHHFSIVALTLNSGENPSRQQPECLGFPLLPPETFPRNLSAQSPPHRRPPSDRNCCPD